MYLSNYESELSELYHNNSEIPIVQSIFHKYNQFKSAISIYLKGGRFLRDLTLETIPQRVEYYNRILREYPTNLQKTMSSLLRFDNNLQRIMETADSVLTSIKGNFWFKEMGGQRKIMGAEVGKEMIHILESYLQEIIANVGHYQNQLHEVILSAKQQGIAMENKKKKGEIVKENISNSDYAQLVRKTTRQYNHFKNMWSEFEDKQVYELSGGMADEARIKYRFNHPIFAVNYNEDYFLFYLPAYDPRMYLNPDFVGEHGEIMFDFIEKEGAIYKPVGRGFNFTWGKLSGTDFTLDGIIDPTIKQKIAQSGLEESKNQKKQTQMKNKKPVVVEKLTVGELKKRLYEDKKIALGQGFSNEPTKKFIDEPDNFKRKIESKGGFGGYGSGFKLTEKMLRGMKNLTEEQMVDFIANIVEGLKGKTEYHNLKFVNRIGSDYGLFESQVNGIKKIIKEGSSPKVGVKLYKHICESVAPKVSEMYEGFSGLKSEACDVVKEIKSCFNMKKAQHKNTAKAIQETASSLDVPQEMVEEMYNIQKEAHALKVEGKDCGNVGMKLESCVSKYKNMSEGVLSEMYDELAEMMDFPMSEDIYSPDDIKSKYMSGRDYERTQPSGYGYRDSLESDSADYDLNDTPEMDLGIPEEPSYEDIYDYGYETPYNPDEEAEYKESETDFLLNRHKSEGDFYESEECEDCDDELMNEFDEFDEFSDDYGDEFDDDYSEEKMFSGY